MCKEAWDLPALEFFLQASSPLITFALAVTALLHPEEADIHVPSPHPPPASLSWPVLAYPAFRRPHSCHLNMRTWSETSSTALNFLQKKVQNSQPDVQILNWFGSFLTGSVSQCAGLLLVPSTLPCLNTPCSLQPLIQGDLIVWKDFYSIDTLQVSVHIIPFPNHLLKYPYTQKNIFPLHSI